MNVFIDTSSKFLTIILEDNNKIIDFTFIDGHQKHTEQTVENLNKIFKKNNISWKDIKAIYSTNGPGSYTGVRVSLTIAKTIKILNPKIRIYLINSLLYCLGSGDGKATIPLSNTKYYFAEFKKFQLITDIKILNKDTFDFRDIKIIDKNFDCINHYLMLKNKFKEVKDFINYKIYV